MDGVGLGEIVGLLALLLELESRGLAMVSSGVNVCEKELRENFFAASVGKSAGDEGVGPIGE